MKKLLVLGAVAILTLSGCIGEKANETGKELETRVVATEEISEGLQSKEELSTNQVDNTNSTLTQYDFKFDSRGIDKDHIPDFLEGDLRELYCKAYEFETARLISNSSLFMTDNTFNAYQLPTVEKNEDVYYRTGFSYQSFYNCASTIFTKETVEAMFAYSVDNRSIINEDGEVCVMFADRGSNINYTVGEFELISKDKDHVKFKYIAHYSYEGLMTDEEFKETFKGRDEKFSHDEEFIISMVNTDAGWRVDEFNLWF